MVAENAGATEIGVAYRRGKSVLAARTRPVPTSQALLERSAAEEPATLRAVIAAERRVTWYIAAREVRDA